MNHSEWSIDVINSSHQADVSRLFERVFAKPLSPALWTWKYADGRGYSLGLYKRGQGLLGHYGSTIRTLLIRGKSRKGLQICDVMVDVRARGVFSLNGPFARLTAKFIDSYIANSPSKTIGFGFPSDRHLRLGSLLQHYTPVASMMEVSFNRSQCQIISGSPWIALKVDWANDITRTEIERLWLLMAADLAGSNVAERSYDWWRHRYANHPSGVYQAFWLKTRLNDQIMGVFVLSINAQFSSSELLDWIASTDVTLELVATAVQTAVGLNAGTVKLWCSEPVATHISDLIDHRDQVCSASVTTATLTSLSGKEEILGNWWLTGGDTDFR